MLPLVTLIPPPTLSVPVTVTLPVYGTNPITNSQNVIGQDLGGHFDCPALTLHCSAQAGDCHDEPVTGWQPNLTRPRELARARELGHDQAVTVILGDRDGAGGP